MAVKKVTEKISRKRKKKVTEEVTPVELVIDNEPPPPLALYGEVFWEYRAKTAEYEKALLELTISSKELKTELSDPKYKTVAELIEKENFLKGQLKERASFLRGAQIKAAKKLGLPIERFLKECFIDYETGVVRIFD